MLGLLVGHHALKARMEADGAFGGTAASSSSRHSELHLSASRGDRDRCETLILDGADVDKRDVNKRTPIMLGERRGEGITGGADLFSLPSSSFIFSFLSPSFSLLFIKIICIPFFFFALAACLRGHRATASLLRSFGGSLTAVDEIGRTALHLAVAGGHANVLYYLLHQVSLSRQLQDFVLYQIFFIDERNGVYLLKRTSLHPLRF
jgi:ankyrin repeat protein